METLILQSFEPPKFIICRGKKEIEKQRTNTYITIHEKNNPSIVIKATMNTREAALSFSFSGKTLEETFFIEFNSFSSFVQTSVNSF